MALSKRPYKGTRDFFPELKRGQDFLFQKMSQTAHLFGYEPYDGPLLEEVDLYRAKSGEELINDQIYSFIDRGERHVAIRPEMTPTVARMVAQIHREVTRPIRWFTIANLMRYERPQKGRLREHWQFNCDIFGAPEGQGEVEILQVAIALLNNFGANEKHFEIRLNDRKIVDYTFNQLLKIDDEKALKLYKIVDRATKVSKEALDKMIDELGLSDEQRKIFSDYLSLNSFGDLMQFLAGSEVATYLPKFVDQMEELGYLPYLKYDPTIVRGLDYYTGMVFEIFDKHPENRRALCGGGAFADLLKIFDETPLAGVGLGLGDVTLMDFLKVHNLLPSFERPSNDLFVSFQTEEAKIPALKLAKELRSNNLNVITTLEPLKFKKIFPAAEKKGARFVAIFGDKELENNSVQFKNMQTKEQTELSLSDIDKIVEYLK
ncbi:MAG: histidine--tRNA ligase [Epsilonproteobacteria bacterium]|nr:MAG: histidine--tRNA ligase [Campylobacterota bacterium]RLA66259.1 MAG: histidine--tRNA ligase [Campylobacterota bacterium]